MQTKPSQIKPRPRIKGDAPWSKSFAFEKEPPMIRGSLLRHSTSSTKSFKLPTEVSL